MTTTTDRLNAEIARVQAYRESDEYLAQFCGTYRALDGSSVCGEFIIAINRKRSTTGPMREFLLTKTSPDGKTWPVRVDWLTTNCDKGYFERVDDAPTCDDCGAATADDPDARTCDAGITLCGACIEAQQDAVRAIVEAERTAQHEAEMDRRTWQAMDDGYRKAAYVAARAASVALLALALLTGTTHAAETITYESPTSGRTLTLPFIGTPAFSDSCSIYAAWEDGSALAFCSEDGTRWAHDPDGQSVPGIVSNPVREPGWYPHVVK